MSNISVHNYKQNIYSIIPIMLMLILTGFAPICINSYSTIAYYKGWIAETMIINNQYGTNMEKQCVFYLRTLISSSENIQIYFEHFINNSALIRLKIMNIELPEKTICYIAQQINSILHHVYRQLEIDVRVKINDHNFILSLYVRNYADYLLREHHDLLTGSYISLYNLIPEVISRALSHENITDYVLVFKVPNVPKSYVDRLHSSLTKYCLVKPSIKTTPGSVVINVSNIVYDDYMYRLLADQEALLYLLMIPYVRFYVPSGELGLNTSSQLYIDIIVPKYLKNITKQIDIKINLPSFINITDIASLGCRYKASITSGNSSRVLDLVITGLKYSSPYAMLNLYFRITGYGTYCCRPYNITYYIRIYNKTYVMYYQTYPFISSINNTCFTVKPIIQENKIDNIFYAYLPSIVLAIVVCMIGFAIMLKNRFIKT